jgi:hypothetical protein
LSEQIEEQRDEIIEEDENDADDGIEIDRAPQPGNAPPPGETSSISDEIADDDETGL